MPDNRIFNLLILTSLLFVLLCACSSKNGQSKGVAKINTSPVIETVSKDENVDSKDIYELPRVSLRLNSEGLFNWLQKCLTKMPCSD